MSITITEDGFNEFKKSLRTKEYLGSWSFQQISQLHSKLSKIYATVQYDITLKIGFSNKIGNYNDITLKSYYDEWSFYSVIDNAIQDWVDEFDNTDVKWIVSINEYITSGYHGGNCWGGEATYFQESGSFEVHQPTRLFEYLEDYEYIDSYTEHEYYGNKSNYTVKYYFLDDFIKAIDNYEQIVHVFIGLPGSGKTFLAKKQMEKIGINNCVLLDDVSQNVIMLSQKYKQKHVMITDPFFIEMKRSEILHAIKQFFPDANIKLYWCMGDIDLCHENTRLRNDGRIISKNFIQQLLSKFDSNEVREDLGDIVYHTQKGTESTQFNIWKKLNEQTK